MAPAKTVDSENRNANVHQRTCVAEAQLAAVCSQPGSMYQHNRFMKSFRSVYTLTVATAALPAYAQSLPQMDQTWYPNQLFWLAVSFIVLYTAVSVFIAPRIAGILSTRENAIADAIREAEEAKRAAESTSGNAASASQNARMRAGEIMAQLQAETTREATEAMAKLDHELNRKADHARTVLEDTMKKASAQVDAAVEDLAQAMVAKLLGTSEAADAPDAPKLKLAKR